MGKVFFKIIPGNDAGIPHAWPFYLNEQSSKGVRDWISS